jgi:hypothetical protein
MNTDQRRAKLNDIVAQGISIPYPVWTSIDVDTLPTELRDWNWSAALWDRPNRHSFPFNDHDLEHAQAAWDASNTFVKTRQEMAAECAQREATQQGARDAEYAAVRQVATDALTAELKRSYLAQPGTSEASFAAALPALLERKAQDAGNASIGTAKSPIPRSQMF